MLLKLISSHSFRFESFVRNVSVKVRLSHTGTTNEEIQLFSVEKKM